MASKIEIYEGSILDPEVDVIVNPANLFLQHGSGLARIIADAAAPTDKYRVGPWWREQKQHRTIGVGNVGVTSAGALPYKAILHAVGPVWEGGETCEEDLLWYAHINSLVAALDLGAKSIAFPAISCGLFRFPVEKAAPIALEAVADTHEGQALDVIFCLMEDSHIKAYRKAFADLAYD